MFSHEFLLLSLRGEYILEDRALKMYKKMEGDVKNKQEQEQLYKKKEKVKDNVNMFLLRLVFEELCTRLQCIKPHDVIRIYGKNGKQIYKDEKILNVDKKRNNFHILGSALK